MWLTRLADSGLPTTYRNQTKRYALFLQVENLGNFHHCKESPESCDNGSKWVKTDMTASRASVELINHLTYLGFPRAFDLKMGHTVPRFIRNEKSSLELRRQRMIL